MSVQDFKSDDCHDFLQSRFLHGKSTNDYSKIIGNGLYSFIIHSIAIFRTQSVSAVQRICIHYRRL